LSAPTRLALIRRPGPRLSEGLVTHIERESIDADLALRQWEAYVVAMTSSGWTVIEVPAADDCADAVFVEDAAVVFEQVAVICRPGAPSRRDEIPAVRVALEELGYVTHEISAPGTLDGGDVLKVDRTMYVGKGGRTNAEGIRQIAEVFGPLGVEVVAVPTTRVLHLKSAVTALPDGRVIGYPSIVDDQAVFPSFLAMPEESGSHVVDLGDQQLLMAASAPKSAELIRSFGYKPVLVDISEFEKLEGCVTCLSVRLRDVPVVE